MKTKTTLTLTLFLLSTISALTQDAREISNKANKMIEFESMEMVTTLDIHDNRGNTRVRQVAIATRKFGETTKTMMRFLSPPDVKGTAMLIYDNEDKADDMWVYLPSLRRVRRIVSSERGNSFMGSEFTNADMTRPNMDDFTHKLLGSEIFNGKDCWKVEMTCKSEDIEDEYGFNKRVSYIEKETYLTQKSELYDSNGKLVKILNLKDYRKQPNGRFFAFSMEMKNVVNNRRSEMIINQFQLGSNLDENSFSTASLEK